MIQLSLGGELYNMLECSEDELNEVLLHFKELVKQDRYTISLGKNREDNIKFVEKNMLTQKQIKRMLLELTTKDCIDIDKHYTDKDKVIYEFVKEYSIGDKLNTYIKFMICLVRCQEHVLVISFHEVKKGYRYIFGREK